MSQNHFILDILGIKGPNIKVLAVETKHLNCEPIRQIKA